MADNKDVDSSTKVGTWTLVGIGICLVIVLSILAGIFVGGFYLGKDKATKTESDCTYIDWSNWSACHSQERGENGTRSRVRNVDIRENEPSECCQPIVEFQSCTEQFIDCTYTEWGVWSSCHSEELGENGTRYRVRNVLETDIGCRPLELTFENQSCEVEYSDCQYSDWGDWSICTHECGQFGTQFRIRNVTEACGLCFEGTSDKRPCNRVCYNEGTLTEQGCECPKSFSGQCCDCKNIDCQLSTWTEWSSCENATNRVRSRDVVRESECAGTKCKGNYTDEQDCGIALKGKELVSTQTLKAYKGSVGVLAGISFICIVGLICCGLYMLRKSDGLRKSDK